MSSSPLSILTQLVLPELLPNMDFTEEEKRKQEPSEPAMVLEASWVEKIPTNQRYPDKSQWMILNPDISR